MNMGREPWNWFIALIVTFASCRLTYGHGRMEEPPARNAAWRYGFNIPANYDDVGLNCGGLGVQKSNGGKCGVCGDAYPGPRYHEVGGKYATNTIVRHYTSGSLIDIKILLSANHKGFMEFRLCPVLDPLIEVSQECLDDHVLQIQGFGAQYPVNEGVDIIFVKAQLPFGLSCDRCVLQWRYHAGNNWGSDQITGQSCLGCGPQEEFYNCADISIITNDGGVPSPLPIRRTTSRTNPQFLFTFPNPTTTTPPPFLFESESIPTTTTAMNVIFPYNPSQELIDLSSIHNKTIRCYPTSEALKPLIGIESWCLQLCTIHCPPSLCVCVKL